MTLFGLDLAQDQNGNYTLFEINGANSGMPGFKAIYGDNRIEEQVQGLLQERYGKIAVNDGTYMERDGTSRMLNTLAARRRWKKATYLNAEKAHIGWWKDFENASRKITNLPPYRGQPCTVLNVFNEQLSKPLVNPFVTEEITLNKLLQYVLLKETEIGKYFSPSALVGLGATRGPELDRVLQESTDQFVLKPLKGCQSIGVKILSREEAEDFKQEEGLLFEMSLAEEYRRANKKPCYIEDLIEKKEFLFEWGISLIQPFVDTRKKLDSEEYHTAIRAIVCNEQFVGAYIKYSQDPQVHFSHSQKVELWDETGFPQLCEQIVKTFLQESQKLNPNTFHQELYGQFVRERGRVKRTEFPGKGVMGNVVKLIQRT